MFRKFVGILNELTPQKFETLANQALEMPIDSEDRLKGCVDRIFIKVNDLLHLIDGLAIMVHSTLNHPLWPLQMTPVIESCKPLKFCCSW